MGLAEDLGTEVGKIFRERWTTRDGQKVPTPEDLGLSNEAIKLEAVVLYADLSRSTGLVDRHKPNFAAEIYKTFLHCAARIVRDQGGEITAYDGDRIMAVFIGSQKNSSAARAALKINWARKHIIQPQMLKQYPETPFRPSHVVAIDRSDVWIARTGVRGANDLVWVGRAANHAAKMTELPSTYPSYISDAVFDCLNDNAKYGGDGRLMWEKVEWTAMNRMIYRSDWEWKP